MSLDTGTFLFGYGTSVLLKHFLLCLKVSLYHAVLHITIFLKHTEQKQVLEML